MFRTNVGILSEDELSRVKKVCDDIKSKDSSFSFDIRRSYSSNFKYILIIYSNDEHNAHVRGLWFTKKMKNAKVSEYYWVTEEMRKKNES